MVLMVGGRAGGKGEGAKTGAPVTEANYILSIVGLSQKRFYFSLTC